MKIVHTEACDGWGGQEIRIINESLGMMEKGHDLHLICPHNSDLERVATEKGIPVTTLPIEKKSFKGVLAVRKWLKSNPTDIINTHSSSDSWIAALACIGLRNRPKIVRSRHISTPVSSNTLTKWLYCSAASHIVTTGELVKKAMVENNGFTESQITSVPTGNDENLFVPGDKSLRRSELGIPQGQIVVGIVAFMRRWKGHSILINAVAQLKNENITLLIVGDGSSGVRRELEAEVDVLGISDQVIFANHQPDVVPWLQAMDIFALPSTGHEGVPQSVAQAMLCELAVISTNVGGTTEALIADKTGLMVETGSVDDLRLALERLINDSALRASLGKCARQHIIEHLSLNIMIQKMERVFKQTLGLS